MDHIKKLLFEVMDQYENNKQDISSEVVDIWNEVVDPGIKKHTKAQRYHNGRLFVLTDSSIWSFELTHKYKKGIIKKINARIKKDLVKDIFFRVGDF